MVLSFQERALPERVFLGCLSFRVHPYRRPPLRCFKCQRYGHIVAACRGDRRCGKCGGEHEFSECKEKVVKCGSCGGGHIAGNRECEQYKQAMRVQQFRETNKGVSYAEAVKKIETCGKVSDSRRREEECPPSVAYVTEDSVVVSKMKFLAFIVDVMCDMKQTKNNADVVRSVVKAAERSLGVVEVEPAALYRYVFSRDRRGKNNGGQMDDDDDDEIDS